MTNPRPHFWEFLRNKYGLLSTKRIWICVQCKISCSIVTTCPVINFEIKFLRKPHYILNKLRALLWKMIPATWDLSHTCAIKLNFPGAMVQWCHDWHWYEAADSTQNVWVGTGIRAVDCCAWHKQNHICHTCVTEHWEQKWFTLMYPLQLLDVQ